MSTRSHEREKGTILVTPEEGERGQYVYVYVYVHV